MKTFKHKTKHIFIDIFDDNTVRFVGEIAPVKRYFKQLHRKAPNEYGNFYGREKAGFSATMELLTRFANDFVEVTQ